jgi:MarR family transcriptional regulator, organic hydroperoxide resistance regulator
VQRQVNDVQFDCLSAAEFKQLSKMIDRLIDSGNRALRLQAYFEHTSGGPTPERNEPARKERSSAQA